MGKRTKANCDHIDHLFPSEYLKAGDLRGREVRVEIEDWDPGHEIEGRNGEISVVTLLHFKGKKKAWILNKTNGKTIATLYGSKPSGWVGREIFIRAARVKSFGDIVDSINVSKREPPPRSGPNGSRGRAETAKDDPVAAESPPAATPDVADASSVGSDTDALFDLRSPTQLVEEGERTKYHDEEVAGEMISKTDAVEDLERLVDGDSRDRVFLAYAARREELLTEPETQP